MNKWTTESFRLAASAGYLDKLSKIYPVDVSLSRKIDPADKAAITSAFKSGNRKKLILTLLDLDRFPIDDPYVGFIRRDKGALDRNPKTTARIGGRLLALGLSGILRGVARPESSSRKMGHTFRKWLYRLGYPVLSGGQILRTKKKVAVLGGGDAALKDFAKKNIGYKGDKGLDLVLKVGSRFVVGEAKFISTSGGTQDKSFKETMSFIRRRDGRALRIAVLDGVVWAPSRAGNGGKKGLYGTIKKLSNGQVALSALLLGKYIKSLE